MEEIAARELEGKDLTPILAIDAEISFADISWDLLTSLEHCEPHGEGNPRPTFISRAVRVLSADSVGTEGKHMRLTAARDGKSWKMIAFGFGEWVRELRPGDMIDVAYQLGVNEWNSKREIQLRIVDLKRAT